MLLQRTNMLVEYENANKALDKAKPLKKQAVSTLADLVSLSALNILMNNFLIN